MHVQKEGIKIAVSGHQSRRSCHVVREREGERESGCCFSHSGWGKESVSEMKKCRKKKQCRCLKMYSLGVSVWWYPRPEKG